MALHNGDCLEIMPTLPPGSVDLILCDLPYGTTACKWDAVIPFPELWSAYRKVLRPGGVVALTAAQPFTTALIASNYEWFRYCWVWDKIVATNFMSAKQMPLIKTEDICVFSSASCNAMSRNKMLYHPQGTVQIDKTIRNGANVGGEVAKARRAVFEAGKAYKQTTTGYPKNILEFKTDPDRVHPTQKPVALM